ncbi:MAG: FtsX-like permease family protein [Oscillospiraceae bacterium]|jgi:putative ABC transport system permease protein
MFCELALRNVRRSLRDYAVYFLTLTFGVCLFYVFNALDSQSAMEFLRAGRGSGTVEAIFRLVEVFSVFVAAVLAGLILYADRFLIRRRKRELGTYYLLGMPQGAVARLLVGETLLIGLAALASGIALGMLGSWALDRLTLSMFLAVPDSLAAFRLSLPAVGKTVLYFGGTFLLVMLLTGLSVSRSRLIDLIRGERKNEEQARRPLGESVFLFILGCTLLGTAYALLLTRGLLRVDGIFFLMLALGTAGTFLLFRSLSGFLLRLTRGHAGYYRGLNMFVLRQWSGKVHTNCLSNTAVCLLLLLAIGVTACSAGLNDTISGAVGEDAPYDLTVLNYGRGAVYERADLAALFRGAGIDPDTAFDRMESVTVYYNDPAVTGVGEESAYAAVSLSDYNAEMAGRSLPEMEEGDLPAKTEYPLVNGPAAQGVIVVPNAMTAALEPRRQMVNINYRGDTARVDAAVREALERGSFGRGLDIQGNYRLDTYYDLMGNKLLTLYMGLYLGLTFLLTAAAVLALQQLSQASDNAVRYQLLSRLGASEKMRRRALTAQVALAFLLPLVLGIVHAAVGMTVANAVIAQVGKVDSVRSSAVTALFLLVVYGGYFAATCLGAWRAVREAGGREGGSRPFR